MPLRKSTICDLNSGLCIRVCGIRILSVVALESDCSDCAYVVDPTRKRHANLAQRLVLRRTSVRTIRRNSSSSQRKTGQKLVTEVDKVGATRIAARALGPSLQFGITNPLPDPRLELHNANGTLLASNDDWQT